MNTLRIFPLFVSVFILGAIALTSCEEDIDFNGAQKETPIIYALLNQLDSVHYVKVTRAFGGQNNAIETALIADSSYFNNIDVVVEEYINDALTRSWTLKDTTITNKEPGAFYSPDQKVYYFVADDAQQLVETAIYKLKVDVNDGEFQVNAQTALVQSLNITNPSGFSAYTFASSNVAANGYKTTNIKIAPGTSQVLDGRIEVFFNEYFSGVPTEKSFVWELGEFNGTEIIPGQTQFIANGRTFYELVKANVTNDITIDKREFTRMKIMITGGTEDLSKYMLVNEPSSSLAQNKPSYTNLTTSDGRRAVGIFGARTTLIQEKVKWVNATPYPRAIDNNSIKELCSGAITGALLFCSDHPNDTGLSYFCN